jgi:hypothetical protein
VVEQRPFKPFDEHDRMRLKLPRIAVSIGCKNRGESWPAGFCRKLPIEVPPEVSPDTVASGSALQTIDVCCPPSCLEIASGADWSGTVMD